MSTRATILGNVLHFMSGQAVAMVFGFVTHAYLARVLGPESYGIMGFAVSVVSYFGILAVLGTDTWGSRSIARSDMDIATLTGQLVSLRLALTVVSVAALAILLSVWQQPRLVNMVILIQAAGMFVAAFTLDFAFQGLERLNISARRQIIAALAALIGILIFMQIWPSVTTAVAVFQGAALVAVVYMVMNFRQTVGAIPLKVDFERWKGILKFAAPFAVTGVVNAVYFSIDVVLLGLLLGKLEVGLYVAAGKVMALGLAACGVFATAFLPVLSRLVAKVDQRNEASGHFARTVIFTGSLIAAGGFLLAPEILVILFGSAYAGAEMALKLLMLNLAVVSVVTVYHLQLVAWNHERAQMYIMIAGALFNVILNLIFIPRFGVEAAAATTVASGLLVVILAYTVLHRHRAERHHAIIAVNGLLFAVIVVSGYLVISRLTLFDDHILIRFTVIGATIAISYGLIGWISGTIRPWDTYQFLTRDQNDSI